jgi:hypothetical protein
MTEKAFVATLYSNYKRKKNFSFQSKNVIYKLKREHKLKEIEAK